MRIARVICFVVAIAAACPPVASHAAQDLSGERIDLVAAGASLHQVYCGICHSVKPGGEPGKAGPTWHGLIGKSTRQRKVLIKPIGVQSIAVDDEYIEKSIRQPNLHLAIRQTAPQMGSAYPPSMPPYPHLTPQEVRSLIAFMKTLSGPENRGPPEVWEVKQVEPETPKGRFEVVVKDRPLVYRVAMADVSYRALSVGLPGGYNYIFDPSTFTVKRAWAGGFLNLKAERTGRGAGYNQYGSGSLDIGFVECLIPLGQRGPIHQDFKDYVNNQAWRIEKSKSEMKETTAFIDRRPPDGAQFGGYRFDGAQAPTFLFRINGVDYAQRIAFESEEVLHYYFATTGATRPVRFTILKDKIREVQTSAGTWHGDTLSIPAKDAAEFYITLILDPTRAQPSLAADADLTSQRTTQQSVKRGMIAYLKAGCVKCHPMDGQSARTGPDLTEVALKYKGRKLLEQILEPSSEINKDFPTWVIVTSDGRVLTGLIVGDDGKTLSVMPDAASPETIVRAAKKDIEEKSQSKVSSMPSETLSTLTREEILDLLVYLEAGGVAAGR
jgi:putative heme-binding domain-containing protein